MIINGLTFIAQAQRTYGPQSVLANGNWYKIGVTREGVYRIDLSLLNNLGITGNIPSAGIRLFGNGGRMLPEPNNINRVDDLLENAILVNDGGDGVFNGTDFILFYAEGPHYWVKDSLNQRFKHEKNLYSDTSYYFITIGGNGRRIVTNSFSGTATVNVNSCNERFFYENDQQNFLKSGREWFGEEFSSLPGGNINRNYTVDWPGLQTTEPVWLISNLIGRSVGANSTFTARINNQVTPAIAINNVSGNFLDAFATQTTVQNSLTVAQTPLTVGFTFNPGTASAQGWLNWFEVHGRRSLTMNAQNQVTFRDWKSVAPSAIANFTIDNTTAATEVWDITNPLLPEKMNSSFTGNQTRFVQPANRLREYIAFNNTGFLTPIALGRVANQNLHNGNPVDYLIITHISLKPQADRLAQFHQQQYGYTVRVVLVDEIYNEFSSGIKDPTAVRDFVKMYYDKAGTTISNRPKYLLLFGAGSFDPKNRIANNVNLVPVYESISSLEPLVSHTSDDFFGLLDDNDDVNLVSPPSLLDIAIGRIPVATIDEAKIMVDKIIQYHKKESLGFWRNQTLFIADDKDLNLHLQDAELVSKNLANTNYLFNTQKIYLDAFPLVSGVGGARYPAVNNAIVNQLFNGTLIYNYTGHGDYQRLSEEAIFGKEEVNKLNNANKLPLFITATCDFAPHDDPTKESLGKAVLVNSINGGIALMTTTRVVFAFSNRIMNDNYLRIAFQPDANGVYKTLGEATRDAKNFTYQSFGDVVNNRKFTLIGDPAMRLGFPSLRVKLESINGNAITNNDTLKAQQKYTIAGKITSTTGITQNNFNGTVYPVVFDQPLQINTLGNDAASPVTSFKQQTNVLFKGKATVTNGQFSFSFVVPKDINYAGGKTRVSLYAENGITDANAADTSFFVGGTTNSNNADRTGPHISAWLNDEKFKNGGITNENPILIARLYDSSGINTSGTGIGHDITAVIDGNERNILVLNDYYESDRDSYQSGIIRFQLPTLEPGKHSLRLKAWDVVNNSAETTIDFIVEKKEKLLITKVLNYPNPFINRTNFSFEHNQSNTDLEVSIDIFNAGGGLVKRIKQILNTAGSRNCQLEWDGTDENRKKLQRGIYFYRIIVTANNQKTQSAHRLILH